MEYSLGGATLKHWQIIKLILISILIGLLSGLAIYVFLTLLMTAISLNLTYKGLIFILPFSGMLMCLLYNCHPTTSQGNNLIIATINEKNFSKCKIPFSMAPLVFLGTILTHLFGGSVGREGSGVQIGGVLGFWIGKIFHISDYERKILLISGVAAGFSAVFGTPLAGTLFAIEIAAIGILSYNAMLPSLTSAVTSDLIVRILGVHHTSFPQPPDLSLSNILFIIIAGIAFGLASYAFVFFTHYFKILLNKYFSNLYLKIFIGGNLMVIATLCLNTRLYNNLSLQLLQMAFTGKAPFGAFIIKLLLTTLCLASGYQGGEVTPLFVVGATLGANFALLFHLPATALAALGLVGVFAGATNAPIASFILYLELFGPHNLIFAMLVCMLSIFISGRKGIYSTQLWID